MPTQPDLPAVVLLRHAQSEWNRQGRFTGWADPALTEAGRAEAERAGRTLAEHGFRFDRVYTSRLVRARDTAEIVLRQIPGRVIPTVSDWRLNERHYGALQGEDKAAMAERVGPEQIWRWRRGYADVPPALAADDPRHPARDPRWVDIDCSRPPNGESLAETRERVVDFWRERIEPQVRAGGRPLISSHGNTLRALLMALDGMSVEQVESFEIPTGVPIVYAFSSQGVPIGWQYLDGAGAARAA